MRKKQIVLISVLSVLAAIILALIVLFGAVFCLRHVEIAYLDNAEQEIISLYPDYTEQAIVDLANLDVGKSIFTQNTDQAIKNIESCKDFPQLKVTRITAKNVNTFQIRLSVRHEMFYYNYLSKYFVLDEQLKVLKILTEKPENLIEINTTKTNEINKAETINNIFNVTNETDICNFIGGEYYQNLFLNLYSSIYSTVTIENEGTSTFVDYKNIATILKDVSFTVGYAYDNLVLNVNLPNEADGFNYRIEIGKPSVNLQNKIYSCFYTANWLAKQQLNNQTIRCYYNTNGAEVVDYLATK